jgi:hypothetical protein
MRQINVRQTGESRRMDERDEGVDVVKLRSSNTGDSNASYSEYYLVWIVTILL